MVKDNLFKYVASKKGQVIAFLITFCLCLTLLLPQKDMIMGVGDVGDIWKTISSFYSSKVEGSYVLYKGFLSIYPYVWLVKLSQMLGMGEWFLLKIFHATLFSAIVAIGIPYIISKIFRIEIKPLRRVLFCVLGFFLWKSTRIIQSIMIDLPSLFLFVFSACAMIKIAGNYKTINKLYFLYAGLLCGCASQYTGQYAPSVMILMLFLFVALFYKKSKENKGKYVSIIFSLLLLGIGFVLPKMYNTHFNNTFVQQLKDEGANISNADDWTEIAIGQAKRRYTMFWGPTIMNQRSLSIMMEDKGEGYEAFIDSLNNGNGYTTKDVIKLVLKHPVDFITSWCNGFLLTVSMNGNMNRVSFLFVSYTALFVALYVLFKRWGSLKGIFVKETLLILAFVIPALVTCVTHYEPRYVVGMQALILGSAIFNEAFWDVWKNAFAMVKTCLKQRSIRSMTCKFEQAPFPYVFVLYCIFLVMCFSNYASIYETSGASTSLLFRW